MPQRIALVTVVVDEYERAIGWYTGTLGFTLVENRALEGEKRWVVVAPAGQGNTGLLLARAVNAGQRAAIGQQTGGRVALFLHTDDFARDHRDFSARGVRFVEPPRREEYGAVAVFEDLYGNRWDLVGPNQAQ